MQQRRDVTADLSQVEALSDDSDDDIEIAGEVQSLKCPLTLQIFKEPYSNKVCQHTFEKYAIVEYYNKNAAGEMQASQARRRPEPIGPKTIECPVAGCSERLQLADFYEDQFMLRKIKRLEAENGNDNEESRMQEDDGDSDEDNEDYGEIDD